MTRKYQKHSGNAINSNNILVLCRVVCMDIYTAVPLVAIIGLSILVILKSMISKLVEKNELGKKVRRHRIAS